MMKTFGGKTYSKQEIDDMITEADMDSDGKVSYAGTFVYTSVLICSRIRKMYLRALGRTWR